MLSRGSSGTTCRVGPPPWMRPDSTPRASKRAAGRPSPRLLDGSVRRSLPGLGDVVQEPPRTSAAGRGRSLVQTEGTRQRPGPRRRSLTTRSDFSAVRQRPRAQRNEQLRSCPENEPALSLDDRRHRVQRAGGGHPVGWQHRRHVARPGGHLPGEIAEPMGRFLDRRFRAAVGRAGNRDRRRGPRNLPVGGRQAGAAGAATRRTGRTPVGRRERRSAGTVGSNPGWIAGLPAIRFRPWWRLSRR